MRHEGGMKYRPDIDGLRAVAVLSVFAYHLRPSLLPAGGLGVDIFFVISGYLIGGIILRECAAGEFSFLRFYERRLRRIVPALLVSILAVLGASALLLMPSELEQGGVSAAAALLSASNLYFWHTVDYFNEAAADMPLLHTWSLGVEEQFYILAPVVLALLAKYARRAILPALVLMLAGSLVLNVSQVQSAPIDAFYLPQGRAWELLAGVILNRLSLPLLAARWAREVVAGLGAALIVLSLALLRPDMGWPGLAAVPPVLGTALIIWTGQHGGSGVARVLAFKPFLWVGLISYSLYLWHWPAIVFAREIALVDVPSNTLSAAIVTFAFLAAWASWRFVEQPFRKGTTMPGRALLAWTGGGAALVLGLCALLVVAKGFPARFDAETVRIASFVQGAEDNPWRRCILTERDDPAQFPADCLAPAVKPGERRILLLGDSHANMFRPALDAIPRARVMEATYAACAPDGALSPQAAQTPCGQLIRKALDVTARAKPDLIVVSWQVKRLNPAQVAALGERLKHIGAPILVIGPTPEYSVRVPKLMAAARVRGEPDLPAHYLSRHIWQADARLAPLARQFATYLSPRAALCDATAKQCALTAGQDPAYYDRQHFNGPGARAIFQQMVREQLSPEERAQLGL
ncbi:acyltransferase family protein [Sphingobium fluviale]|uniref:Acyltransferase n=1 Tax=Sphingobium fluviale TaxID=2506423 RepID=A0A4Q1KK50_9SPHN|nr:acyltransferase family protein [Sphingobium fluviale]RXR29569.1 acyltransferase [Sphingobium fluviale]